MNSFLALNHSILFCARVKRKSLLLLRVKLEIWTQAHDVKKHISAYSLFIAITTEHKADILAYTTICLASCPFSSHQ